MTNREKFTEIFGCEIVYRDTGEAIPGHCKILIASDKYFNEWLKQEYAPSATDTNVATTDTISRQAAIEVMRKAKDKSELHRMLVQLPSAQPNLSEAYSKAMFTWLMDYQIRAAELKGRYTPYEVLSWVINDWRKEHERSD